MQRGSNWTIIYSIFYSHVQEMVPQIHVEHEMQAQVNPTYSTPIAKTTIHKSNNYSMCLIFCLTFDIFLLFYILAPDISENEYENRPRVASQHFRALRYEKLVLKREDITLLGNIGEGLIIKGFDFNIYTYMTQVNLELFIKQN